MPNGHARPGWLPGAGRGRPAPAAWIGLLDRAAGIGLLTAYGNGYYAVHPAIPWHLHSLFSQHYGAPGSPAALQAIRAWTTAISALGDHCHRKYEAGHADVIRVLTLKMKPTCSRPARTPWNTAGWI